MTPEGYGEDINYLFFLWRKIGWYVFPSSQQNPFSVKHILSLALGVFESLLTVPAPQREPGENHKSHFICFNSTKFLEFAFQLDKHYSKLKGKKKKKRKKRKKKGTKSTFEEFFARTTPFLEAGWFALSLDSLHNGN